MEIRQQPRTYGGIQATGARGHPSIAGSLVNVQARGGQGAIANKGRGEDAVRGTMPKAGAAASPLDARFATQPSAVRTQASESIRVGQRVLAENPEVSSFERCTRVPEPNFESWLHFTVEMPTPGGSNLTINMLRSEEWLRSQIGFVVA